MRTKFRPSAVVIMLAVLLAQAAHQTSGYCEEGMWLPYAIPGEILAEMQASGLGLDPDEIWNASGTGIANAVVSLGSTGSLVSPDGLILTNHHVAYGAVQRISTSEKNFIEEGFLAGRREDEVPAHGYIAYLLLSSEDVTDRVRSAPDASMSPVERHAAIEDATKLIVREAEEGGGVYCEISALLDPVNAVKLWTFRLEAKGCEDAGEEIGRSPVSFATNAPAGNLQAQSP